MDKRHEKPSSRKSRRRHAMKKSVMVGKLRALPRNPPTPPLLKRESQNDLKHQEPNSKAAAVNRRQKASDVATNDVIAALLKTDMQRQC